MFVFPALQFTCTNTGPLNEPVYNCARVYNDCTVTLGRSKVSYNVCGHSLIHYDSINVEIELLKFMEQFQIVYCFAKAVCSSKSHHSCA